jgi:hypothetical protein
VKRNLSKESCAEQFRVIAARLDLANGYTDARVVQGEEGAQVEQAGRLLEQATQEGLIELPRSLDGWMNELEREDDLQWRDNTAFIRSKLGPDSEERFPFSLWLLNPHVRFFTCVVDRWLSLDFPAQLRTQSRGLGFVDTGDLDGEKYVAFWRGRLQTFADACRLLAGLLSTTNDRPDHDFKSGSWFAVHTAVPLSRLRHAASPKRKSKRVRKKTIDGVECYSVSDAQRWWPENMQVRESA